MFHYPELKKKQTKNLMFDNVDNLEPVIYSWIFSDL